MAFLLLDELFVSRYNQAIVINQIRGLSLRC